MEKSITKPESIEEIQIDEKIETKKIEESDVNADAKKDKGVGSKLGKEEIVDKKADEEMSAKAKKVEEVENAPSKQKGESEGINNVFITYIHQLQFQLRIIRICNM